MANKPQHRGEVKPQSNLKIPTGHFNQDGLSNGKRDGAVRSTPDAYNHVPKQEKK